MRKHPYQKLLERKRHTPVATTREVQEAETCAALALRNGTTCGRFIRDVALKFHFSREILESNVQDELARQALGYVADAWGVDPKAERKPRTP